MQQLKIYNVFYMPITNTISSIHIICYPFILQRKISNTNQSHTTIINKNQSSMHLSINQSNDERRCLNGLATPLRRLCSVSPRPEQFRHFKPVYDVSNLYPVCFIIFVTRFFFVWENCSFLFLNVSSCLSFLVKKPKFLLHKGQYSLLLE